MITNFFNTEKSKRRAWRKAVSKYSHDIAHDFPISFWSNPDEEFIDFFIKKNGNPIANIISKKEKGIFRNNYINPIHAVAKGNPNPKVLQKIIEYAGTIDFFETLTGQLPIGYNMIHDRYQGNRNYYVENAKILLGHGIDIRKVYSEFNSCAIHAVATAPEEYSFLLDSCLSLDGFIDIPFGGRIFPNQTPLAIAAGQGRLWACRKLLECGADIEGKNGNVSPVTACVSAMTTYNNDVRYDDDLYACLSLLVESGARQEVKFPGINLTTEQWVEKIFDGMFKEKVKSILIM